jgi:hypothetical protein
LQLSYPTTTSTISPDVVNSVFQLAWIFVLVVDTISHVAVMSVMAKVGAAALAVAYAVCLYKRFLAFEFSI